MKDLGGALGLMARTPIVRLGSVAVPAVSQEEFSLSAVQGGNACIGFKTSNSKELHC